MQFPAFPGIKLVNLKRNPCEDSELTALARSVSSTVHSRGVLEDGKLLVPTWIII